MGVILKRVGGEANTKKYIVCNFLKASKKGKSVIQFKSEMFLVKVKYQILISIIKQYNITITVIACV